MKRRIQAWIIGLLLTLIALPVHAATFDVTARGRDETVARTNAGVNAVRDCMQSLVPDAFLRANMEAVRKQVILQSARYVRTITVHGQQQQGALVVLTASVDVDAQALADTLSGMNMDDAARQQMVTALAGMEPPAPAQAPAIAESAAPEAAPASAEPAAQGVAQAPAVPAPAAPAPSASDNAEAPVSFMGGTAVAVPMADGPAVANGDGLAPVPGQATPPIVPDDKAYVRGNDAAGMDMYLDDTRTLVNNMVSPEVLAIFLDEDEQSVARMLLAMNARNISMRVDEADNVTLLLEPQNEAQMTSTLVEGKTLRDVLIMLGVNDKDLTPSMQPVLDRKLEDTGHTDSTILKLEGRDLFFGRSGSRMVAGDHKPNIAETLTMLAEGVEPFVVEGDAPLRFCVREELDIDEAAQSGNKLESLTVNARPVAGGWVAHYHSNLGVSDQTAIGAMDLSNLLVYDDQPPFFLLGLRSGPHTAALLDELSDDGTLPADQCAMLGKLDNALVSLGGGQVVAAPLRLPAMALSVNGAPDAVQGLMTLGAGFVPGQDAPVQGWDKVTQHSLQGMVGMPVNLLMALRQNTLIAGLMNSSALTQPPRDTRAVLSAALEGSGLTLPEAMSSVVLLDVRQLWKEAQSIVNDAAMGAMIDMAGPGTRQVLQQLFAATPPVVSVIAWSDSPDPNRGACYIALTKENTEPFYLALRALIEFFDK